MNHFSLEKGELYADGVPLERIAQQVGTPTYVYAGATLDRHVRVLHEAFGRERRLICYSVKANSNLSLLERFAKAGAGFDIVSGGELQRVLKAGGSPQKVVFAGVGKTRDEMVAALKAGILMFNVESAEELKALDAVGQELGVRAPFALRVNPDVVAQTHRHISTSKASKFGIDFKEARALYAESKVWRGVKAVGLDFHIGSQLTKLAPVKHALAKVAKLYRELGAAGLHLTHLDVGGGIGIRYENESTPTLQQWAKAVLEPLKGLDATLVLEPGRVIVGNASVLLTRVLYRKKQFIIVDAGMNDLIRPALYEAHHEIVPVRPRRGAKRAVDVVGPVCESADVLGKKRRLPPLEQGDLLAVMSAGAYGMSMSSNYNSRPRAAEVLVDGDGYRVIRERERIEELWRNEV
ncbi:MAG: diaminopimelate decarboxylase [Myxococcaceae bacterium]|nr:diaminopimelate decarboxylase [Myxococcaceae bacterium]